MVTPSHIPMPDQPSSFPRDSRDRIRSIFSHLLKTTLAENAAPKSGTPDDPDDLFNDDPFADVPFAEPLVKADPVPQGDGLSAFGMDGLSAGYSGDGQGKGDGALLEPELRVAPTNRTAADPFAWDGFSDAEADLAGQGPSPDVFADANHMEDLLSANAEVQASSGQEKESAASDAPAAWTPEHDVSLDGLPDLPPSGAHRVAIVQLSEMGRLNEYLQIGWRIVQMLPSGSPAEFVVALRYAGYAA